MIKVILFDADGVLINGEKFADHLQRELKISSEATAPFFKGRFKDCVIGRADLKTEIAPFLPQWGWNESVDDFLKLWFDVEHQTNNVLSDWIGKLREKGILCYIATNQEKYRAQYIQDYMKLKPLFDGTFASNEMGVCKPDEEFFNKVVNELEVKKDKILLWDDTQGNVDSAIRAGLNGELFTSNDNFKEIMSEKYKINFL